MMKKKAFKHPINLWNDGNVRDMRKRYGSAGYGRYLFILEMLTGLYNNAINLDEHTYSMLAKELELSEEQTEVFINDLVDEFNLLSKNEEMIWCDWLEVHETQFT